MPPEGATLCSVTHRVLHPGSVVLRETHLWRL
jgi:hypothetical protein